MIGGDIDNDKDRAGERRVSVAVRVGQSAKARLFWLAACGSAGGAASDAWLPLNCWQTHMRRW